MYTTLLVRGVVFELPASHFSLVLEDSRPSFEGEQECAGAFLSSNMSCLEACERLSISMVPGKKAIRNIMLPQVIKIGHYSSRRRGKALMSFPGTEERVV